MAEVKPLRLKAQQGKRQAVHNSFAQLFVRVIVDTGVFHLDGYYDYLVPSDLDDKVQTGVRLLVPFGSRTVEAIVIDRVPASSGKSMKSIEAIISPFPLLNREALNLILDCAKRWAAHPYDLISSAIPPRSVTVERNFVSNKIAKINRKKPAQRVYYQFSPGEDEYHSLSAMAVKASSSGGVLVLLPDERDVQSLVSAFSKHFPDTQYARLDSSMSRADRYFNFLKIASGQSIIGIGTRSAVFSPIANLQTIFIYRETSESFYDARTPGWNARDVALIRSTKEDISLVISGYAPSAEVSRLIENKWISVSSKRAKTSALSFEQQMGELLPNRIFPEIREALRNGAVLFMTPRKGYAASLSCAKCRNEALCSCGGKLFKRGKRNLPECALCSKEHHGWKCAWCGADKARLLGRGSERFAEELGRAFPGFPIVSSEGEHILQEVPARPSLVLATPGSLPHVVGGYFAVVILEANRYFTQVDMRAHERARAHIFQAASKVAPKGKVLIVIDSSHPITASVSRWNPSILSMRDLREREDAALPPYYRAIEIFSDNHEVTLVADGFKKAIADGRIPASTRVLGPAKNSDGLAKIILLANVKESQKLIDFVHEFARKRSVGKKDLLKYRVDPYSLT